MIELTEQQLQALEHSEADSPRLVNPRTNETFVLLRLDEYERLKEGEYDDSPWTREELQALAWEAGKHAGSVSVLDDLRRWYVAHCDGDWEHTYGVNIGTLDNPGWSVEIDLRDTLLEGKPFDTVEEGLGTDDLRSREGFRPDSPAAAAVEEGLGTDDLRSWLRCGIEGSKFRGFGDPGRLEQILGVFIDWAKSQSDWLALPHPEDTQARDDREFWDLLNRSMASETCRHEGCEGRRVQSSVLCPFHHFEQITGRACPFPGKPA